MGKHNTAAAAQDRQGEGQMRIVSALTGAGIYLAKHQSLRESV